MGANRPGLIVMGFTGDADFTNATGTPTNYVKGHTNSIGEIAETITVTYAPPGTTSYPNGLAPFMPEQLAITAVSIYGYTPGSDTFPV